MAACAIEAYYIAVFCVFYACAAVKAPAADAASERIVGQNLATQTTFFFDWHANSVMMSNILQDLNYSIIVDFIGRKK